MSFKKGYQPPPMDKAQQAVEGHRRTAALPPPPLGTPTDEIVSVAEAAELTGTTQQNIQRAIKQQTLPAYRLGAKRVVLVADLAASPAAERQAARQAEIDRCRRWAAYYADPANCSPGTDSAALVALWTRRAEELPDEPTPTKRPVSDERRAQLAAARMKAAEWQAERRAERERDLAAMRARLEAGEREQAV
jgi:excisionase family DNA binding protein